MKKYTVYVSEIVTSQTEIFAENESAAAKLAEHADFREVSREFNAMEISEN